MARILVVDDDHEIVRLVKAYLEKAGCHVLTAHDGETALHTLRREKPDLLVLDLMLPDRDGWDLTRLIRTDEQLAATPIIMLTARVTDSDKIVGLEIGADDYITKPFNPREVVARVRALLRRSQRGNQAPKSQVLQVADLLLDLGSRTFFKAGKPVALDPLRIRTAARLDGKPRLCLHPPGIVGKRLGTGLRRVGPHPRQPHQEFAPEDRDRTPKTPPRSRPSTGWATNS